MGVHGLFDVLQDHSQRRSLKRMAHDAFADTRSKHRALRLGIDAAIWQVHAQRGHSGANPMLRTLFYRLLNFIEDGILPVVVFDGPHKPRHKRGQKVGPTRVTALQKQICEFCDAMGIEHRIAPGEAEAELAWLAASRQIDAVVSDDGDTLLFGAPTLIRNIGKNLSGSRAQEAARSPSKRRAGTDDEEDEEDDAKFYKPDADCFTLAHIQERLGIDSDGMILIALLSGADYDTTGVQRCGSTIALALAKVGFGTSLCNARRTLHGAELDKFLVGWREDVREELRTNSRGLLNSRKTKLASELPEVFPSLDVLDSYLRPATTQRSRYADMAAPLLWAGTFDIAQVSRLCRQYFEWTHEEMLQKCLNKIFIPMMMRAILDRVAPNRSLPFGARPDMEKVALAAAATASDPTGLHSFGFVKYEQAKPTGVPFAQTNRFRIKVLLPEAVALVRSTFDAVDENVGKMDERRRQERIALGEDPDRETRSALNIQNPDEPKRYWIPALHVRAVAPGLVATIQAKVDAKADEEREKTRRATERAEAIARGEIVPRSPTKRKATAPKAKATTATKAAKGKGKAVDPAPTSSPYFPVFSSPQRPPRQRHAAESDLDDDSDDEPGASQITARGALDPPSASKRRASSQVMASQPSPTKLARTGVRTMSIAISDDDEPMVDVPAIRLRPSSPVPAPAPPVKRAKAKPLTATQAAARRAASASASVSPPPTLTPPRPTPVIDLTTP